MPSGPDVPRCDARKKNGQPCRQDAGWGTPHPGIGRCKHHGGCTPNQIIGVQNEQARRAVKTYGLPIEIDPHQALLNELYRTYGAVTWMTERVHELNVDQIYGPVGGGQGSIPEQKPHVLIGMLNAERKHLESVAKTCITCGIAERQVQLAEQQGHLMGQIVDMILTELGVRDRPEVPDVVRRAFTLIPGGQAAA